MKSIRWICIQKQNNDTNSNWFFEPSLKYTRRESISEWERLTSNTGVSWIKAKEAYGWSCKKVELALTIV